jgi:hypothetical protein
MAIQNLGKNEITCGATGTISFDVASQNLDFFRAVNTRDGDSQHVTFAGHQNAVLKKPVARQAVCPA